MITAIVLLSGITFVVMVAFGLFGLSRILIYWKLAEFTYNQSFVDNLFYYGSYMLTGYFLLVFIEFIFDELKKNYPEHSLLQGFKFHSLVVFISTTIFYLFVHLNYEYIKINYFVILVIIGILYALTELFYPDSENLNQKNDD
ncbi:SepA family multidrug efflux transporter [Macrococcus equipercicus]|uniref:Multidrug resistance efflux pump SepA n=2 Tax=Macrococcus equipercicus TaxID=69967 RepID=A0A9Q9BSB7_9STAP|nr:SepA family multidrug efflux transporter [Macrococcus equipercicus]UTH14824.1 SepA family multidrug efflux transporter [Macrococcus equipercicus]